MSHRIHWYHSIIPFLIVLLLYACVHEPILPTLPDTKDSTNCDSDTAHIPDDSTTSPPDTTTTPPDTTTTPPDTTNTNPTTKPCDPDTVYFERDILPILVSNCAKSGCHDAASAQDNVVLTEYSLVVQTGDVRPGDLFGSDLYEVLVEDDPDKKMPPSPNPALTNDQLLLIQKWILQGARDLSCDENNNGGGGGSGCDTVNVSFSKIVDPILTNTCKGCHNSNSPSGGIDLSSHAGVAGAAQSGRLYGAIAHLNGFKAMPQGGNQLPVCDIEQIKAWIDAGAKNS